VRTRLRRPWPLRAQLTVAFASVIALVLAATGVLIYTEFRRDVDRGIDEDLSRRAVAFRGLSAGEVRPARIIALAGERFAQVYGPDGAVRASSRALGRDRLLTPAQVRAARTGRVRAVRAPVAGTQSGVRVAAFAIDDRQVAAVAESRDVRDRELDRLSALLLISLPGALLLASFTGYQVAGGALRPVERMRARAAAIGDAHLGERLPEPGTGDELDRLAGTLNALLARRQEAIELEQRVVADASHELRTPVSVLRARIDVALRGPGDAPTLRRALEGARDDATRLSRLADDLLLLARADEGRLPLRPEPLDVQDLVESAVARHAAAAAEAGRPLIASVPIAGGAVVLGDPDRLGQALDNLVVNALRHGRGAVRVTAVQEPGRPRVELVVADDGPGFPADFLPRAFERFSQVAPGEGSGLGLALVEAIVRAHDGTVSAGNGPHGGAEVRIALPVA
jgi:signal transduction histidine kinase